MLICVFRSDVSFSDLTADVIAVCTGNVSLATFFFVKQKTAYEMRISDWSSDVCSSDLGRHCAAFRSARRTSASRPAPSPRSSSAAATAALASAGLKPRRSEEHTSELQSLMRISYAVFCLKKKKKNKE